jgi:CRP-like cAMP-binding protein
MLKLNKINSSYQINYYNFMKSEMDNESIKVSIKEGPSTIEDNRSLSRKDKDSSKTQTIHKEEIKHNFEDNSHLVVSFSSRRKTKYQKGNMKEISLRTMPNPALLKASFEEALKIHHDKITLENLIIAMNKPSLERTTLDISVIIRYINDTDLARKFRTDRLEETSLYKIIYFCSMYINYKFIRKGKILFRIGDVGDKFFIIFSGQLSIMKPIIEQTIMSPIEYLNLVKKIYKQEESYILKLIVNENYPIYPVDIKDLEEIDEIIFRIKYRQILMTSPSIDAVKNIFEDYDRDPFLYGLDLEKLIEFDNSTNPNDKKNISDILQKQLVNVFKPGNRYHNQIDFYRYITNEYSKKSVTIYKYSHFMYLKEGNSFGDYAIDSSKFRTATIRAEKDTHLGYIELEVYKEYVQIEKQRSKLKEISFLSENFFFKTIKKLVFQKRYFPLFIYEECYKGDILFRETNLSNNIFFIKEGEVELTINRNVLELSQITKSLINLNIFHNENCEIYELKNEPNNFIDDLLKKKLNKLFFYGSKELLGLEEFFYDLNHLYSVKVTSDKVKLYKIDYTNMLKILEDEKECYPVMETMATQKMSRLIERLCQVQNISLRMLDTNNDENKQENLDNLFLKKQTEDEENIKHIEKSKIKITNTEVNKKAFRKIFDNKKKINEKLIIPNNTGLFSKLKFDVFNNSFNLSNILGVLIEGKHMVNHLTEDENNSKKKLSKLILSQKIHNQNEQVLKSIPLGEKICSSDNLSVKDSLLSSPVKDNYSTPKVTNKKVNFGFNLNFQNLENIVKNKDSSRSTNLLSKYSNSPKSNTTRVNTHHNSKIIQEHPYSQRDKNETDNIFNVENKIIKKLKRDISKFNLTSVQNHNNKLEIQNPYNILPLRKIEKTNKIINEKHEPNVEEKIIKLNENSFSNQENENQTQNKMNEIPPISSYKLNLLKSNKEKSFADKLKIRLSFINTSKAETDRNFTDFYKSVLTENLTSCNVSKNSVAYVDLSSYYSNQPLKTQKSYNKLNGIKSLKNNISPKNVFTPQKTTYLKQKIFYEQHKDLSVDKTVKSENFDKSPEKNSKNIYYIPSIKSLKFHLKSNT